MHVITIPSSLDDQTLERDARAAGHGADWRVSSFGRWRHRVAIVVEDPFVAKGSALGMESARTGAFAIVYADGPSPMATELKWPDWAAFTALLTGALPLRTASYQELVARAREAASVPNGRVLQALEEWRYRKMAIASEKTV